MSSESLDLPEPARPEPAPPGHAETEPTVTGLDLPAIGDGEPAGAAPAVPSDGAMAALPRPAGQSRNPVAIWLFSIAAMLLVMIGLGGATRLTGSGLSIMEWAPVEGVLWPMTDAEWQRLFGLYQKIPQYALMHHGFGIEGFKDIFWLEWTHRLWGRLIGVVFLVPFMIFAATRRLRWDMIRTFIGLFVLGGMQGAVGWFMVASGFEPDSTAVSPYRLTAHLTLALALYAAIVWFALNELKLPKVHAPAVRVLSWTGVVLVALTIVAGGFVAGTHAGFIYNTFPLIDDSLIPPGYAELRPFIRNPFENLVAVQFDHRVLATLSLIVVSIAAAVGFWSSARQQMRRRLIGLAGMVCLQYGLGVATLLLVVPVSLATMHQMGAALLLAALLVVAHATSRTR